MERSLYIPPARRQQQQRQLSEDDQSISSCQVSTSQADSSIVDAKLSSPSKTVRTFDGNTYTSGNSASSHKEEEDPPQSEISIRESSDEDIIRSCLLLADFPPDVSELGRGNILSRFLRKGALSKWIGPNECLLTFKNERLAVSAAGNGNSHVYKLVFLKDVIEERGELLSSAKELYYSIKPDMDSRVAHRLIGAALGIKVTSRPNNMQSTTATTTSAATESKERATPVVDAWDD